MNKFYSFKNAEVVVGQIYFENFLYSLGFMDIEVVVDAQIFQE